MKRKFKVTLAVFLVIILGCFSNVFASENNSINLNAEKAAKRFLTKIGSNKNFVNEISLYDPDGKENGILLSLKNSGYIVVNLDDYSIPEYSLTSNNKFITDRTKKYIYLGPLSYYEKNNNKSIDLKTKKEVTNISKFREDYSNIKRLMKSNKKTLFYNNDNISNANGTVTEYRINTPYQVPNYYYNPNGICCSTASAMMLRHFQLNYINDLIPENLRTSDGVALIKTLVPYIQLDGAASLDPSHTSAGSYPQKDISGLKEYISTYDNKDLANINMGCADRSSQVNALMMSGISVRNNNSFVVSIGYPSKYGDHEVTGYGYVYDESKKDEGGITYEIVNDGWGSTDIHISADAVYEIAYMMYVK